MSRRGDMFIFMLNIFFLLAIILIFSKLHAAFAMQNGDEGIGTRQAALLHTYSLSEQTLLYVDEAAKFAAFESLATSMEKNRNIVTPKCPETYASYPLWTRAKEPSDCFPAPTTTGEFYHIFEKEMEVNLRRYLANAPGVPLGLQYKIIATPGNGLQVIGLAQEQITLPIVAAKDARQQAITPLLRQEKVAGSFLDFTPDTGLPVTVKSSTNGKPRSGKITDIVIESTQTPDTVTALKQYTDGLKGTHYLIDEQGTLYQILPEDQRAFALCKSEECSRIEDKSIFISLVNPAPTLPEGGKCAAGELLQDFWCTTCKKSCYEQYTPEQFKTLEALIIDIRKHQNIPVQNINLEGKLLKTDNPGPQFKQGPMQTQWLADLLTRVAAAPNTAQEQYEDAASTPAQTSPASAASLAPLEVTAPLDSMTVTSCFGWRERKGGQMHYGVDFRAQTPLPVHAIADGVVQRECDNCAGSTGFGKNILIDHPNGLSSHYSHLSVMNVKVGDKVKKGQVIGLTGNTGGSDAPHLHFAIFTHHVENPISTEASNGLCVFPDEALKSFKVAASNCPAELSHETPEFAQSCAGVQPMQSAPSPCGLNSMPLNAQGSAEATETLKNLNGNLIDEIKNDAQDAGIKDYRLIIAFIAVESNGKANIVSPTGCAGLGQICLGTAREDKYASIFGSGLQQCHCTKNRDCTAIEAQCAGDPRFDPIKNIKATTLHIKENYQYFNGKKDQERFAIASYNAGPTVVKLAIEKTGKPDPSWEEVAAQIDNQVIYEAYCVKSKSICSYFDTPAEQANKVKETKEYVDKVSKQYVALGGSVATAFSDIECNNFNVKEMGTYSFAPSFSVTVPDLLTTVDRTASWAKETYAACDGEHDTRVCLKDRVEEFNRNSADLEITSCEDDAHKIFYSLQAAITDCRENKQDACGCTWRPPPVTSQVQISFIDVRGVTTPVIYTTPEEKDAALPVTQLKRQGMEKKAALLTVKDSMLLSLSDADESNKEDIPVTELQFEKNGAQLYMSFDNPRVCGVYKTTNDLCAQVKQKIPILSKGSDFETPQIKFALYLNDVHPPEPVQQITATTQTVLTVSFTPSPSDDVSYYRVSCSALGDFKQSLFVNGRERDKPITSTITVDPTKLLCDGVMPVANQHYQIKILPVDISGNVGQEKIYDTAQNQVTGSVSLT